MKKETKVHTEPEELEFPDSRQAMIPSPSNFDDSIDRWLAEHERPWSKLKTWIGLHNLRAHLPTGPLRILDAGGGSGIHAIPLAQDGHMVDLADFSAEMVKAAGEAARHAGVKDHLRLHQADVMQLESILPPGGFDAVLCHDVLQYLGDAPRLLSILSHMLAPQGILSLIGSNRHSIPLRKLFMDKDPENALKLVGARTYRTVLFQTQTTEYAAEEILEMLPATGLTPLADYGIRCLSDYWGDNETKQKPEIWASLEKLEKELTGRYPYKLLARSWQVIARRM